MASQYRTARKKITDALVEKIKRIDGNHPYNSNVFNNVHSGMIFLDQIYYDKNIRIINNYLSPE